jgi:hypothetical protein
MVKTRKRILRREITRGCRQGNGIDLAKEVGWLDLLL